MPGKDLAGQRFHRLTALRVVGTKRRTFLWLCRCDCGRETTVVTNQLTSGKTTSCGCQQRTAALRHGGCYDPEYRIWVAMRVRCDSRRAEKHPNHAGRGIRVCERWLGSYERFLEDMGRRPSARHTIERIDNNGNYEPGNCRWATYPEQALNRRNNRHLTLGGVTLTLKEWGARLGVKPTAILSRLRRGWPIEKALVFNDEAAVLTDAASELEQQTGEF